MTVDRRHIHRYAEWYMSEVRQIVDDLDERTINALIEHLVKLKERKGRLFIIGNGGSAANASHAVNDFRKICHIEAHTPTDNVAELTARINDDGLYDVFTACLSIFSPTSNDAILVLSVGGGTETASPNIMHAVGSYYEDVPVFGIVGANGGYTAKKATACIIVPTTSTPQVESFQSILLHLIVNHPDLKEPK